MSLQENPFVILSASPRDRRETLQERADDLSLLSGRETETALEALLQPLKRLRAELSWFPNTLQSAADTVLSLAGDANKPPNAQLPEGLGCPLAEANALAALYFQSPALYDTVPKETPAETPSSLRKVFARFFVMRAKQPAPPDTVFRVEQTAALLLALNRVLNKVTVEETLAAVNEDRKQGGWEPVSDKAVFASILDERLQTICSMAAACVHQAKTDEDAGSLVSAFAKEPEADGHDMLAAALVNAYLLRIQEAEENARAFVCLNDTHAKADFGAERVRRFEAWWRLVSPVQKLDAHIQHLSTVLASDVLDCVYECFCSAPRTSFQADERIYTAKGVHFFTITYQNVTKEMIARASENVKRLIALFPEDDPFMDNLILTLHNFQLEYDNVKNKAENALRRAAWKQEKEYREHPPQTVFGTRYTEVKAEE